MGLGASSIRCIVHDGSVVGHDQVIGFSKLKAIVLGTLMLGKNSVCGVLVLLSWVDKESSESRSCKCNVGASVNRYEKKRFQPYTDISGLHGALCCLFDQEALLRTSVCSPKPSCC
jgi:hypothetical protein